MMDCPQRNVDPRRHGNNLHMNESEGRQLPGWTSTNTRNRPPPCPVPSSSMKNQLRRSASNQVPTRTTGKIPNNASVPFPNSCTTGQTRAGNLPTNIPERHCTFKYDVSSQTRGSGQVRTKLPNEDQRCPTTVYGDSFPGGGKLGQRADEVVFVTQSSEVEGARAFRTVGDHNRVPDVRNTTGSQGKYFCEMSSNNVKYINPKLVQKVLDSQRSRAQTPVGHLQPNSNVREVPLAGQRSGSRFVKPEHHSSDTSLSNRLADCRVTDPETVSTGSQKESGYHSGDSVGDRLSENSDPGRNVQSGPTVVVQPFPAIPGSPDDVCEHYFLKGDSLVDLCSEQERSGNYPQAINFLNQAIDLFQQATNVLGVSHDNVLRMRLKHNRAILHRRKLLKQSGCSTETPVARRLPCTPLEVKEMSTADDVFSTYHQPTSNHFNNVPIGLDCSDGTRGRGVVSGRGPRLCSSDETGNVNFAEGRNSESVSVGVCDPDHPEAGLQWTSDDVKDINIYATLPKNRRRIGGGPPVTNATTVKSVQTKLQSEISVSCRNEESQHPSVVGNLKRNASGYRDYQQRVPSDCGRNGMTQSREPVPVRTSRQVTSCDVPRLIHDSASHYFRSDDANVRRMAQPTSDQIKFVRF